MFSGLRDWLVDYVMSALTGFDSMLMGAAKVLTETNDSVWNGVEALSNVLKPFCYTVIAICLLIEIVQVLSKVDIIKWEHGLKLCVKMVLAKVCIDVAPTFLKACYLQAASWISSLSSGSSIKLGAELGRNIEPMLKEVDGVGTILGLFITASIVIIAIKICGILVQVIAYGRLFELYIYLAISPLPCAFLPLGNGNGDGFSRITGKFFKSFAAVCLQGVMILLSMRIYNIVMSGTINTLIQSAVSSNSDSSIIVSDLCYVMLLGAIVLVMAVAKCGSWAKNILDAM